MIDKINDLRNRLLANPRFRAAAGRLWPFNLIARRRARQLFDISAGFVYSQVMMSCIELGWFERLRGGPCLLETLAADAGLAAPAAQRLAQAAHALRLTEARSGGRIALGPLGAAMIGDAGIAAMSSHHALLYADMAAPLALLRGENTNTQLGEYWGYATSTAPELLAAERTKAYSELMASSQPMIAEQVLTAFRFDAYEHVLDVGGGTGAFLSAVHARYPALRRSLFDLPGVVAHMDPSMVDAPATKGGSFLDDDLPAGADLISLVRIIHDHDDDVVLRLLTNIRRQIRPDATLLIAEPLAATRGAETVGDTYFGFYLLAMGSGKARTQEQIDALLAQSGFAPTRRHGTPVPLICSVLSTNPI